MALIEVFGTKREEARGVWRQRYKDDVYNFNFPQNSTRARIAWETGVYGMVLKWVVKERGAET